MWALISFFKGLSKLIPMKSLITWIWLKCEAKNVQCECWILICTVTVSRVRHSCDSFLTKECLKLVSYMALNSQQGCDKVYFSDFFCLVVFTSKLEFIKHIHSPKPSLPPNKILNVLTVVNFNSAYICHILWNLGHWPLFF